MLHVYVSNLHIDGLQKFNGRGFHLDFQTMLHSSLYVKNILDLWLLFCLPTLGLIVFAWDKQLDRRNCHEEISESPEKKEKLRNKPWLINVTIDWSASQVLMSVLYSEIFYLFEIIIKKLIFLRIVSLYQKHSFRK